KFRTIPSNKSLGLQTVAQGLLGLIRGSAELIESLALGMGNVVAVSRKYFDRFEKFENPPSGRPDCEALRLEHVESFLTVFFLGCCCSVFLLFQNLGIFLRKCYSFEI